MRKLMFCLAIMTGFGAFASGASAAQFVREGVVLEAAPIQVVEYRPDWREIEYWRHRRHEEWRRHEQFREFERWEHRHD